ncbi:MAG: hypothetical protein JW751_10005 [Polyangiaceae bacterium]|nr:hypothetical protein [Polyangiaceae bacterium]
MTSASSARSVGRIRRLTPPRRKTAIVGAIVGMTVGSTAICAAAPPAPGGAGTSAAPEIDEDTSRSAARELAREGLGLLNEERFAEAEDRLRRAFELFPAATVAILRGRALERLDRLVEAVEAYEVAVRIGRDAAAPPAFRDAAREAEAELHRLRPEVPRLTITLAGASNEDPALTVLLDDRRVPAALLGVASPIDPGQHFIVVSYGEMVHDSRWVTTARGGEVKVLMRVDATPPLLPPPASVTVDEPPRSLRRGIGWVTVGVGGGGLVVGLVSGLLMLRYKADLDDECRPHCPGELADELQGFRTTRTVSAMGYGVGFLAVGLGAGMVLTAPPRPVRKRRTVAKVSNRGIFLEMEF